MGDGYARSRVVIGTSGGRLPVAPGGGVASRPGAEPLQSCPTPSADPLELGLQSPRDAARPPFNRAPCSIRPACDDADERTPIRHFTREFDRLAADLAVFDVAERTRRQVHRGLEPLATIGTLHADKLGGVHCSGRAARLKHGLEPVQRIDGLRIEWFARLLAHVGNLHHAKPPRGVAVAARERNNGLRSSTSQLVFSDPRPTRVR